MDNRSTDRLFMRRRGRLGVFGAAALSAFTLAPSGAGAQEATTRVTAGSFETLAQRPGGNYIRSTDADTRAQVLTRLGDARFATTRPEAFAHLEQAVDALMASENIPAQYRAQILATLRADSNFTNYNIRGVAPDEMSSTEVVDAMLSAGGHVVGEGTGLNVRMETPVVPGTRSGHTGYRAERWVVEATIDGRQVLMVFTRPEECNNFSIKIIDREQAPVARAVEVAAQPCINVRVRAPRGVNFTNENVDARVLVLDMNSGTTLPVEDCPVDTGQVQANCAQGAECQRILREAADRSPGFQEVVREAARARGANAPISRIFVSDARINADEGGTYITIPVRADKLNERFLVAVCFDWDGGGSSVSVIHHPGEANAQGFVRDELVMEGSGANMDVFRGHRRVSRGADRTD